ncbi:hybrid sensor histidine kinase/response regulator [Aliterella atlantica]|uniref:histidine kinase n=1 Tax=Aliterella atlantica CENA595 TaxID=1618023 RepID=A0A0D8ZMK4_9CYAN|nr:hybrid sensor histidine kinase/response regulator [Aliterella atlantica]KJH69587.1 histidine kinase [Aliterella atlantica CENA595]
MNNRLIKVLLIEDNPGDARLLQELLMEAKPVQFELKQVDRLSQGLQQLQENDFNVILLDLSLPDTQGLETFVKLHDRARNTPIVVITGLNDETVAISAVQLGAQDYLLKDQVNSDVFARSIRYAIERKRAEQKIREQAALLDIATDAILVRDLTSRILFWNKGAEHLYGWSAETVLGKTDDLLYPQSSPQSQEAQKILFEQGEWSGELHQVTKNGKEVIVESRWTLMRDDNRQPKSILIVGTNVTERKKLEAQFFRAQRLESVGTLASGLAHDLNNILTPILVTSQLLQIKLPSLNEQNRQLLKMMEANTKRGADIIKQVLLFARGIEGEQVVFRLEPLILEIQQIVEETFPKSITTDVNICLELWAMTGNATQIHQVFMNLCINARDAMPDGGTLTISAQNVLIDEERAQRSFDAKVGSFIKVTVADTGMGIAPETIDRIFEPFFTTKEYGKGTGLGLSTVIGIIKGHAGFVNVESEVGKGTKFNFFLPALVAKEPVQVTDLEILVGNNELVLVVDDEAAMRESSRVVLEAYNYQVLTACNGIEALELYIKHKDKVSLVLMDLMMPGMDGSITISTIQRINPKVKIIAVSGSAFSIETAREANSDIQKFLPKPYTAEELVKIVTQVCRVNISKLI